MKLQRLVYLSFVFALTQCNFNVTGDCKNHIYQQIENQSKTYKIIKFDRGCGATTGNSIQLSLVSFKDSLPNQGGNLFISNSKVGGYVERDTSANASWLTDRTILIKHDKDLDIFKKATSVGTIKIVYEIKQ